MTDSAPPLRDIRPLLDGAISELPCGADIDELLEQAADGRASERTEHQRDCPHCQAALLEFSRVWAPVAALAAEPVGVPAALRTAVAGQIRKLTADVWYTLELAEGGVIQIAARVVARIARDAARKVPGVRVALGRSTRGKIADAAQIATLRHRHPHAAVGVLGRTAVVELAIAAQYGQELDVVAREVQERAIAELHSKVGLRDVCVNVTIDDVIA